MSVCCLPHLCKLENIVQGGGSPTTTGFSFSRRCQRRCCCPARSRSQPLVKSKECVSNGSTCLRTELTRSRRKTSKKTCWLDAVRMHLAFRSSHAPSVQEQSTSGSVVQTSDGFYGCGFLEICEANSLIISRSSGS